LAHGSKIIDAPLGPLGDFGAEAVAIFFVISGYVIAMVSNGKSTTCTDYVVARCARVLPVAIIALGFTFAIDSWGHSIAPAFYDGVPFYNPHNPVFSLLLSLTFTSELWGYHIVFGSDEPYWSLVLEVWYYAGWGVLIYARGIWKPALVVFLALVGGPRIVAYFPIWLIGAGCYYLQQKPMFQSVRYGIWTKICIAAVLIAIPVSLKYLCFSWILGMMRFQDPELLVPFLSYFYLIGIAFGAGILLLTPPGPAGSRSLPFARVQPLFAWFAGISFTLYLVHEPALVFVDAVAPHLTTNGLFDFAMLVAAVLMAATIALISERPRRHYRQAILALIAAVKNLVPAGQVRPAVD